MCQFAYGVQIFLSDFLKFIFLPHNLKYSWMSPSSWCVSILIKYSAIEWASHLLFVSRDRLKKNYKIKWLFFPQYSMLSSSFILILIFSLLQQEKPLFLRIEFLTASGIVFTNESALKPWRSVGQAKSYCYIHLSITIRKKYNSSGEENCPVLAW